MQSLVHSLDSTRLCTAAINNGSLGGTGFTAVLDVQGLNYNIPGALDSYHPGNPNSPIIGTEVGSTVTTRGIYTNDTVNGYVASYRRVHNLGLAQSGDLGGNGGKLVGQSMLPGPGLPADLIGPVLIIAASRRLTTGRASVRISARWTPAVFPRTCSIIIKPTGHSNPCCTCSRTGTGHARPNINIWAYGNCQAAELFINGVSQGRQTLNIQSHVDWIMCRTRAGTLQAIGYINSVAAITNTVVTTGTPAAIALTAGPQHHPGGRPRCVRGDCGSVWIPRGRGADSIE